MENTRDLLERETALRIEAQDALEALDPPEAVTDLHTTVIEWHAAVIEAERAVIARAGEVSELDELQDSAETRAYDALLSEGLATCRQLQAKLDAIEDRDVFAGTPWLPSSLMDGFDAVLGCDTPTEE